MRYLATALLWIIRSYRFARACLKYTAETIEWALEGMKILVLWALCGGFVWILLISFIGGILRDHVPRIEEPRVFSPMERETIKEPELPRYPDDEPGFIQRPEEPGTTLVRQKKRGIDQLVAKRDPSSAS